MTSSHVEQDKITPILTYSQHFSIFKAVYCISQCNIIIIRILIYSLQIYSLKQLKSQIY